MENIKWFIAGIIFGCFIYIFIKIISKIFENSWKEYKKAISQNDEMEKENSLSNIPAYTYLDKAENVVLESVSTKLTNQKSAVEFLDDAVHDFAVWKSSTKHENYREKYHKALEMEKERLNNIPIVCSAENVIVKIEKGVVIVRPFKYDEK